MNCGAKYWGNHVINQGNHMGLPLLTKIEIPCCQSEPAPKETGAGRLILYYFCYYNLHLQSKRFTINR